MPPMETGFPTVIFGMVVPPSTLMVSDTVLLPLLVTVNFWLTTV